MGVESVSCVRGHRDTFWGDGEEANNLSVVRTKN
jgi:hypothetical protein